MLKEYKNVTIKCSWCGKFITYEDLENGDAECAFIPDSNFGPEIHVYTCYECLIGGRNDT